MDSENELKKINTIINIAQRRQTKTTNKLYISPTRGTMQFYTILENGKKHYLSKRHPAELNRIANQMYVSKILKEAKKQKNYLDTFMNKYNSSACYEIYDNLPEDLKKYIIPCCLSAKQYSDQWAMETYETKGIKSGERFFETENGEKVRSKSELTIANKLFIKGIKYRYEEPHYMKGFGTIYPDFTILNAEKQELILWEHFGLMDSPEYVQNCLRKLKTYASNNIFPGHGLITTYESREIPLDTKTLDVIIQTLMQ